MRNIIKNFTYILLFLIIFLLTFLFFDEIDNNSSIIIIQLFDTLLIPLLIFYTIGDFLVAYGFVDLLGELFKPFFNKVFRISSYNSYILFMTIICGSPSNAKYTKDLLNNSYITKDEANKIIVFSFFCNPLFMLNICYISLYNNLKLTISVILSHYLSNIIIGIIMRKNKINEKVNFKNMLRKISEKNVDFNQVFFSSIKNTIKIIANIFSIIIIFTCILTIINNIIEVNDLYKAILNGFIEITNGVTLLSALDIHSFIKQIILVSFFSFGGLSIHMQIKSIIKDTQILYKNFLLGRILQVIISIILVIIINMILF